MAAPDSGGPAEDLADRAQAIAQRGEALMGLRVPARADRLKLIRSMVEACGNYIGAEQAWTSDLTLAVDEACQNVVRHAYAGCAPGDLVVRLARDADYLLVAVLDEAPPIDPSRIAARPLESLRPGGLGTHFIWAVMDHVEYRPATAGEAAAGVAPRPGNELRMIKRLRP